MRAWAFEAQFVRMYSIQILMIWAVATPLMSTLSILTEMQMVILDWMAVEMVFVPDIWS